jgi:hypothetical protein
VIRMYEPGDTLTVTVEWVSFYFDVKSI